MYEKKQWQHDKVVPFEIKSFDEEQGIFEGYAAVFDTVDDGGDIIEPGAFTKTLAEWGPSAKNRIQILALHNDKWLPIGKPLDLREDSYGLYVKGKISNTSMGKDVKILLKDKVLTELSVGYDAIKYEHDTKGIRHLKELRLYEFSPVVWAMNEGALVTNYKSLPLEKGGNAVHEIAKKLYSFDAILTMRDIEDMRWKIHWALQEAVDSVLKESEMENEDKLKLIDKYLTQYHKAVLALYAKTMQTVEDESPIMALMERIKGMATSETKAGRVLSSANLNKLKEAMNNIQEILKLVEVDPPPKGDEKEKEKEKEQAKQIGDMLLEFKSLRTQTS